jgi:hypothetical protein
MIIWTFGCDINPWVENSIPFFRFEMTSFSCVMLHVHESDNFAWIPMCASELYFGLDVMCHLGCFVPFVLYVCGQ